MLDIKEIRKDAVPFMQALAKRNIQISFAEILETDRLLREVQTETDTLKSKRNKLSEQVAKEKGDARLPLIEEVKGINSQIKTLEDQSAQYEVNLLAALEIIPNPPLAEVLSGKDENDNTVVRTVGSPKTFPFPAKDHTELGESLGILDFHTGAKLSGARFTLVRKQGALLERALINFMLDIQTREFGYEECLPPLMVNPHILYGTGQLPKFEADLFQTKEGRFLIPTAEVPLTNIYAGEIIPAENLPLQYTAFTPCFRSEAGSYGKDTKGYLRQHQFNKVELVWFTLPEQSEEAHQKMVSHAEHILQLLELPYRTMLLCGGDMGFSAAKCYDIEVWLPGQSKYREISSCSNCTDFQARRANIRYKDKTGKTGFVHTLNGSGLAAGRTLIAVMENYQTEDGCVLIPKALQPYMHGLEIIRPETV